MTPGLIALLDDVELRHEFAGRLNDLSPLANGSLASREDSHPSSVQLSLTRLERAGWQRDTANERAA
jgi:hypothetical protein